MTLPRLHQHAPNPRVCYSAEANEQPVVSDRPTAKQLSSLSPPPPSETCKNSCRPLPCIISWK